VPELWRQRAAGWWVVRTPTRTINPARLAYRDRGHCGREACRCTHSHGCDHGWIQLPAYEHPATGLVYEPVGPCPVCRPEATARQIQGSVTVR
jgi:hypothetical protein